MASQRTMSVDDPRYQAYKRASEENEKRSARFWLG